MEPRAAAGWRSNASCAAIRGAAKARTRCHDKDDRLNDSKNLILAVALSALVLLGWTWAANRYFPAANAPSGKVEAGKQQSLPQPAAQPAGLAAPKKMQNLAQALASAPRVQIRTPS